MVGGVCCDGGAADPLGEGRFGKGGPCLASFI